MNMPWKYIRAFTLALALLLPATQALANVAANTQIFTEAKLTYHDGVSEKESTASVTVTVALVPALADLNEPPDQITVYADANTATNYSYTVMAGGNGPDDYTLDIAITESNNTTSAYSAEIEGQSTTFTFRLGATVTTAGSDTTNIRVPSDGEANTPGSVNGIEAGNIVVINGEEREVESVDDPASGTATIVLKTALSTAPGAGVSVWEQRSFDVKVVSGNIDTAGESITLLVKTTVTNSAGEVFDEVLNTFTSGAAVLTKYARNLTTQANNNDGTGGRDFTVSGSSARYYTGGIKVVRDDVIEYVLLVENAGTAPVTDCDIHDVLPPEEYVTLLTGIYGGKDFLYVDEAGNESSLTAAADGDTATVSGSDITFYIGTGATSSTGGTIDVEKNVKVLYRVQVK